MSGNTRTFDFRLASQSKLRYLTLTKQRQPSRAFESLKNIVSCLKLNNFVIHSLTTNVYGIRIIFGTVFFPFDKKLRWLMAMICCFGDSKKACPLYSAVSWLIRRQVCHRINQPSCLSRQQLSAKEIYWVAQLGGKCATLLTYRIVFRHGCCCSIPSCVFLGSSSVLELVKLASDVKQRTTKTTKNLETIQSRETEAPKQRKISQVLSPR